MTEEKGRRVIHVSIEAMEALLSAGRPLTTTLPDDIEIKDHWVHDEDWTYVFLLESEEWEPVNEAEKIPQVTAEIEYEE